jgi:hypothetical protein
MYTTYRSKQKFHHHFPWQIILLGLLAFIIFAGGLYHLRNSKKEILEKEQGSGTVISAEEDLTEYELKDFSVEETTLVSLSSSLETGIATRGVEDKIFYFTSKASLPPINRETEFYEVWLVRQSPYDFFSVGEMVTNETGEFVLEWVGTHNDTWSYNRVVVTREAKDNDLAPNEQIAIGQW